MKTERRMSGRSSSSAVGPSKRTWPFSMNTARSASSRATFTDCSTTTIVVPRAVDLPDDVEQLGHDGRRQPERQLVDHEHAGPGDQRAGQGEHLLLAARQGPRRQVEPRRQRREQRQHLRGGGGQTAPGRRRTIQPASRRFSATVRLGNVLAPPGMSARPRWASRVGGHAGDLLAAEAHRARGRLQSRPLMPLSTVDLPAPFVPSRATSSPGATSKSNPSTIRRFP